MNADPTFVVLAADIEVARAVPDITDLLVLVEMLLVERLHFGLVGVAEALLGDVDLLETSSMTPLFDMVCGSPHLERHTRVPWR